MRVTEVILHFLNVGKLSKEGDMTDLQFRRSQIPKGAESFEYYVDGLPELPGKTTLDELREIGGIIKDGLIDALKPRKLEGLLQKVVVVPTESGTQVVLFFGLKLPKEVMAHRQLWLPGELMAIASTFFVVHAAGSVRLIQQRLLGVFTEASE
jgi:hypothetical protein